MKIELRISIYVVLFGATALAQDYPRFETFLGYTYTRANSATTVPAFSANGGSGQFGINANHWLGFVMDMGAVHNGNISDIHMDTTVSNYLFGPRVSLRKSRVTPYLQILWGGAHVGNSIAVNAIPAPPSVSQPIYLPGTPTVPPNTAVTLRQVASQTAFAMTVGGGLDIKINRHASFRPIQLEYYLTRFQNYRSANDNNQNNLRYSTGFNFTFGGEAPAPLPPPPAPTVSCWDGSNVPAGQECPNKSIDLGLSVPRTELCPGEVVTIAPAGKTPDSATYRWAINGEEIARSASLDFGTTGRQPGSYKVGLSVSAPGYNEASSAASITVRPYRAPTGSLEVSPSELWVGEQATVAAKVTPGQCGGALRAPRFTASEGSFNGDRFDSSGVQFDPADNAEQRKTVRLLAEVADDKGAFTAEANVVVKKKATLLAKRLPDIIFPAGNARVNNCGKRVLLEELKPFIDNDPTGKVVLVGHVAEKEAGGSELDQKRALNAAAVISAGQGVCSRFPAGQILVSAVGSTENGVDYQSYFCGTSTVPRSQEQSGQVVKQSESDAKDRRVEVWFIPTGGTLPASLKDYKDAASLPVASLGCPQ